MIIWLGRENVVGRFFREDLSKVGIFQWEGDFGFRFFCSNGEFYCYSEFGNERGVWEEMFAIISEDSVDLVIIQGVLEVLVLHVVIQVVIELRIIDGVYVDVSVGMRKGFQKKESCHWTSAVWAK